MSSRYRQTRRDPYQSWEEREMGIDSADYWARLEGKKRAYGPSKASARKTLEQKLETLRSAMYPLTQAGYNTDNEQAAIAKVEAQIAAL